MEARRHQDLLDGLSRVRKAKFATDVPLGIFLGVVVVFFILKWLGFESWFKPIYQLSFVLFFWGFAMLFIQENGNCQPSCRLNTCDYAAILSSNSPSISSSFAAIC